MREIPSLERYRELKQRAAQSQRDQQVIQYFRERKNDIEQFFLISHPPLHSNDDFIDVLCPQCGCHVNAETVDRVEVHSRPNLTAADLDDRRNWGLVDVDCPRCGASLLVDLEAFFVDRLFHTDLPK